MFDQHFHNIRFPSNQLADSVTTFPYRMKDNNLAGRLERFSTTENRSNMVGSRVASGSWSDPARSFCPLDASGDADNTVLSFRCMVAGEPRAILMQITLSPSPRPSPSSPSVVSRVPCTVTSLVSCSFAYSSSSFFSAFLYFFSSAARRPFHALLRRSHTLALVRTRAHECARVFYYREPPAFFLSILLFSCTFPRLHGWPRSMADTCVIFCFLRTRPIPSSLHSFRCHVSAVPLLIAHACSNAEMHLRGIRCSISPRIAHLNPPCTFYPATQT